MRDIDQHHEVETYKLLRDLANKTKKISLLERRINKLENYEKERNTSKYIEKIEVDERVQQQLDEILSTTDYYVKSHLSELVKDKDVHEVLNTLEQQIVTLKKQEQALTLK